MNSVNQCKSLPFALKKKGNTIAITKKLNLYILPHINPILSEYFTNLTGITQETLYKEAKPFKLAMKLFYMFCKNKDGEKYNMYSMGNDYDVIKENLKLSITRTVSLKTTFNFCSIK